MATAPDNQAFIKQPDLQLLSARIQALHKRASLYSYQEYFALAAKLALQSLKEGNFGVGSILIIRHYGTEYLLGGRNQVFSRKDASLHSDKATIQKFEMLCQSASQFELLMKAGHIKPEDVILTRSTPDIRTKTLLISTLESCAGCFQTILTHNTFGLHIDQICSGIVYPDSGSSHPDRSKNLPPTWQRLSDEQNISRFTLWDPEVQHLCDDLFNFSEIEPLQRNYFLDHPQDTSQITTNIEWLMTQKKHIPHQP